MNYGMPYNRMPIDFKFVGERCKVCTFNDENIKVTTEKLFTINKEF